jgi:hypothetical protein
MDPLQPPPMSSRAMEEARAFGTGEVLGGQAGENYYKFMKTGLRDEPIPAPRKVVGGELVSLGSKQDPNSDEHTSRRDTSRRSSRRPGGGTSRTSRSSARSYRTGMSQVAVLKQEKTALKVSSNAIRLTSQFLTPALNLFTGRT